MSKTISDYLGMIVRIIFISALTVLVIIRTLGIGLSNILLFASHIFLSITLTMIFLAMIISFLNTNIRFANKLYYNNSRRIGIIPTTFVLLSIGALFYILADYAYNDPTIQEALDNAFQ